MTPDRAGELVVVDDEVALARAVADRFLTYAGEAIAARGRFDVALAGGSTPTAAYTLLASASYRTRIDWTRVRFFFSDERCVGPEDTRSNFRMARDTLLDPLAIAQANVFRMRGEDEPIRAAADYAALVRAGNAATPRFDLIMLGLGPDGHTASLFPGTDPFEDDALLVRAPATAEVGTRRLTFTPALINAARDVLIATAGVAKAAAFARARGDLYDPWQTPVQCVAPQPGQLCWLVDRSVVA